MSEQPMTRRERRELERREAERLEAERKAQEAAAAEAERKAREEVAAEAARAAEAAAQTQAESEAVSVAEPAAGMPTASDMPVVEVAQPMTRRQLRELERRRREAEVAAAAAAAAPAEASTADASVMDEPKAAPEVESAVEPTAEATVEPAPDTTTEAVADDVQTAPADDIQVEDVTADETPGTWSIHDTDDPAPATGQPSPLFPEVSAPRSRDEGPVLLWNPSATAEDAPRRARASFGLPVNEQLPVVRDTHQTPEPGSSPEDIDDYFSRLLETGQQDEPPTGSITMPSSLNVDETDALPRTAIQRHDEQNEPGWRDTLNPAGAAAVDDETDGIDDPGILEELFGPRAANSAVSAKTVTGFTAPADTGEYVDHLSRSGAVDSDPLSWLPADRPDTTLMMPADDDADATVRFPAAVAPVVTTSESTPTSEADADDALVPRTGSHMRKGAESASLEDDTEAIPTSWKIAAVGAGAAAVGVIILAWNLIQGWLG